MSEGEMDQEASTPGAAPRSTAPDAHFHRSMLDSLLEGFQTISEDWAYTYVNPAAAAQGRSSPEALIGKRMWEAYPGIERSELFTVLARCMDTRSAAVLENLFTFVDGTQRWFELRIEPIPSGLCIHSIDIDDRKRAQEALVRLNANLEAQAAARTLELVHANQELEAFSYSISHHLRSPLRALDGFSRALLEKYSEQLDDRAQDYLVRIRKASQRMDELIAAMLLLAEIANTPCSRAEVNLSRMASEIAAELQELEPDRRVDFQSEPDLRAVCDSGLARVLLHHLLANAWKFTAKTAAPVVRFSRGTEPKTFVVSDNGIGFDMRYANKLFVLFQRLHEQDEFSGIGMGLATVSRIVRKHGGDVRIAGKVGEGASVTFRLEALAGQV